MNSSRLAQEQLHYPLSPVYPAVGPPSFPSSLGSLVQIYCRLEGSLTEKCARGYRVTIDMLPDVALLEVFDCYVNQLRKEEDEEGGWLSIQAWDTLVHVCRQWRTIVLGSPRRLDLRLFCTEKTPVKQMLDVWPPLPIVIMMWQNDLIPTQTDNIVAALEHNGRVCQIDLWDIIDSQFEEVLAAMQQPFPALAKMTILLAVPAHDQLSNDGQLVDKSPPVVPESFLGGSAPRLQHLKLQLVPFPRLPNLLSSATGLVSLNSRKIPHSGYFSPEAMVRCLSTLTRLEELQIGFESPLSRPVRETRRHLRPPTRSTLPALTFFWFKGVSEYLEDLVAQIDAPLLDILHIGFFHQLIFDTPQLAQFLARTPNIQPPAEAYVYLSEGFVEFRSPRNYFSRKFRLEVMCRQLDWQLSSLTHVCSSSFPGAFISTLEHLYIAYHNPRWEGDIEYSQWLEVLLPFTAVKYLYLTRAFTSLIAPALQDLTDLTAGEVLPSLQNLYLEDLHPSGPVQGAIGKFVAARQRTSYPITVSHWDKNKTPE